MWSSLPGWSLPPKITLFYTTATTSQICWIFRSWYVPPRYIGTFFTLFATNCLYSPSSLKQCNAMVLSSQQIISSTTLNPLNAFLTFTAKLIAICPDTSSNRVMIKFYFAKRYFDATKLWLAPDDCLVTACTAAHAPFATCITKCVNLNFFNVLLIRRYATLEGNKSR